MRDGTALAMHQANAKRNALLLGQFEFLQTRQEAFERTLRVSTLVDRLRWAWNPLGMVAVVDAVQRTLLDARRKELAEAAAKPRLVVPVKLTIEKSNADLKAAYEAKRELIEREKQDFLFALGKQWSDEDMAKLEEAGIKPVTDNRIAPNIYLITGLERQNRSEFKAFPHGEEDGIKAEIASALFKDAVKVSGFTHKSSEQFKDGITCGESHLELYLDYTESLINGRPKWKKFDGGALFPDPASREYDFSDARYVYKVQLDMAREDLINLYPEHRKHLEESDGGKLSLSMDGGTHRQPKDYPTRGGSIDSKDKEGCFDLVERYYKKWVEKVFVGDKKTGEVKEAEHLDRAQAFVEEYKQGILRNAQAFADATAQAAAIGSPDAPPPPPEQDPERFLVIKRMVPEVWCFAHTPGIEMPLADERAWFYPLWKEYPFVPYFARFSTAPLTGDERHLLVQGLVHGVKGAQEKHNKAETLLIRHLNSTANSGWLAEEDAWVDPSAVRKFGTAPGVNLEYKQGRPQPQRISPAPLSSGHAEVAAASAESIKAQLGINADLLAVQEGGSSSGRAIALRQRQGLLMVQELFDNLSRSREIAGRFLLSQMGEMYDTETAMKVLGEGFLVRNFPPPMLMNPESLQQEPMMGPDGQPMKYDREMAELAIAEVLSGELGTYDVSVGEAVASETTLMSYSSEVKELATAYPGIVPPEILVKYSQLPESAKAEITSAIQRAQAAQAPQGRV